MKATLGLDVGTTSVKAVVLAEDGRVLAEAASDALPMRSPHPGWAIQPTLFLHDAVIQCLRSVVVALTGSGEEPVDIVALTAAVQSGSIAPVSKSGVIAEDLTTWMDTRSSDLVEGWNEDGTANTIRRICGWMVHPGQGLPQLGWLRNHDPKHWDSSGRFCSADDLVAHWLTGQWVTNPSNAAGMALMDVSTGEWSQDLCDLVGIAPDQLSELRPCGEVIGSLTPAAAETTGIDRAVVVSNGGHDQACTALALGVTEPTQALLAGGTAWVLTSVIHPEAASEVPDEMNLSIHVVPGMLTASKYLGGMGVCLEWWLATCDPELAAGDRFSGLAADLADFVATTSTPYFHQSDAGSTGPSTDPSGASRDDAPGAGSFTNTTPQTTNSDRAYSIMEYAAFQVQTTLLALPDAHRPTSLTIVGGVTRMPGWAQLIADICDLPVSEATNASLPALGAAVLGGVTAGLFPSAQAGAESLAIDRIQHTPNPQQRDLFVHRYQTHLEQENQP